MALSVINQEIDERGCPIFWLMYKSRYDQMRLKNSHASIIRKEISQNWLG
jgi:hypothetical protein